MNKKVNGKFSCFPNFVRKRGSTDWTIGRLMTIVLLIMVLVLVAYGVSTKGLNPLIERAGGMFDSVQILFGFGDRSVEKDRVDYFDDIAGVGKGVVSSCRGSCSIKLENGLSFGDEFNWTQGSLLVKSDSQWNETWDSIDNLPLAIREREVNKILRDDYIGYEAIFEDNSFMGSGIVPIHILVKRKFGERKYFKWENGVWFEEKDNMWEKRDWGEDIDGLNKIYSSSKGFLGGDVFYRIGTSGAILGYLYVVGNKDIVSFEDIGEGENSYALFDIFNKDSGKINDGGDFETFQNWFSSEKEKIRDNQGVLDEGMREFEELLPSESSGDFEGEPYYLLLERDSDGEGVFYLETSVGKYGLKGKELKLVKGSEESGWKVAGSSSTLVETDEEFEEKVKLHKIRKFLEVLCG